jgi:hypothetical protein
MKYLWSYTLIPAYLHSKPWIYALQKEQDKSKKYLEIGVAIGVMILIWL